MGNDLKSVSKLSNRDFICYCTSDLPPVVAPPTELGP